MDSDERTVAWSNTIVHGIASEESRLNMGIYVKGARMPNCCLECMLYNGHGCKATMQMFHPITNVGVRVDSCPLVEVEEPHGRLIDADALADDLEYDAANEQDIYKANCASWLRSNCNQTIIEAENE